MPLPKYLSTFEKAIKNNNAVMHTIYFAWSPEVEDPQNNFPSSSQIHQHAHIPRAKNHGTRPAQRIKADNDHRILDTNVWAGASWNESWDKIFCGRKF